MSYQVLARKWRPHNFTEVVGQTHVVQALTNALQHNRLHHAYLFTGTRGVGKTTLARILAKAVNCESRQNFNPCCNCTTCHNIDDGRFIDLIEVDAASRTKVEDTRELLDNVQYAPSQGRYKVYLIDEVHMLSGHSFNALLKTLEEPPEHVKFLLATTDPQKIPVTVLSRCLQFNLKRLDAGQIRDQMSRILGAENTEFETAALQTLAHAADGSMRDGLSLLDQAIVHGGGQVQASAVNAMLGTIAQQPVLDLLEALASGQASAVLNQVARLAELTPDFANVLQQLLNTLHRIALVQAVPQLAEQEAHAERLQALATGIASEDVQLYYQIALLGQRDLPLAPEPRGGLEMVLLRMLAFRPASNETQPQTVSSTRSLSRNTTSTATERPKPARTQNSVASITPPPDFKPAATAPPPEHFNASAQPAQTPNPIASIPAAPETENWRVIVEALGLRALTRELANHCVLKEVSETQCVLLLTPYYTQLASPGNRERLEKALQTYYKRPLKLVLKIEEITQDTPAIQIEQQKQHRQRTAETAIEQDETVQALQQTFDARIVAGTTRPLDSD